MNDELRRLQRRFSGREPGLLGASASYAVLCPLVERPDGVHLLFEVRAAGLRQGGEVCFPGGKMEPGENETACALRETEEELAIPPFTVTVLGRPDFLCSQRGFLLRPVLGLVSAEGMARLRPSPAEVADTFTVPLDFFRRTPPQMYGYDLIPQVPQDFPYASVGITPAYPWGRGRMDVPVWHWEGRVIWGMTARIVRSLVRDVV